MSSTRLSELQEKSMPELWQMANRLGVSRKGKKDELVKRILDAQEEKDIFEKLRLKMKEYEETREELKTLIESVSNLAPELEDEKAALEKSISEQQEKITKVSSLIPKLQSEKEKLNGDVLQLEKKISDFDQQIKQILRTREFFSRE